MPASKFETSVTLKGFHFHLHDLLGNSVFLFFVFFVFLLCINENFNPLSYNSESG